MKLSVIIPVYNEAHRLHKNILEKTAFLNTLDFEYELIMVDDGSNDGTLTILEKEAKKNSKIKILTYSPNRGKGYAVRKGMRKSRGEYIFFIDADGSTPIEYLHSMLSKLELGEADVVIGSRNLKESNRQVPQPFWRQVLGKIGNILIRKFLSLKVKDTQCGFKGFTREASQKLFSKATINRWGFDFEILVMANTLKLKVVEVPVRWMDSEGSRFQMVGGSITTLLELLQVKLQSLFGKYKD